MAHFCFLAVSSALVGGFLFGAGQAAPPIALLMDFESKPSAISVEEMKREVAALMKSTGLQFEWRWTDAKKAPDSGISFKFRGKCFSDALRAPEISELAPFGETVPLASTPVREGRVQPYSQVECDQIRKCIAMEAGRAKLQRDRALGRAMGRVVAHELYHILGDTRKHAAQGVAKSVHDAEDLVSNGASFTPAENDMLSAPPAGVSGSTAFRPK